MYPRAPTSLRWATSSHGWSLRTCFQIAGLDRRRRLSRALNHTAKFDGEARRSATKHWRDHEALQSTTKHYGARRSTAKYDDALRSNTKQHEGPHERRNSRKIIARAPTDARVSGLELECVVSGLSVGAPDRTSDLQTEDIDVSGVK